jgi:hypothetical protein
MDPGFSGRELDLDPLMIFFFLPKDACCNFLADNGKIRLLLDAGLYARPLIISSARQVA